MKSNIQLKYRNYVVFSHFYGCAVNNLGLTLAKLFSNWYVGAVVGFALGTLKGDLTTASIGLVIGATVSWIFKKCLMSKK